MKKITFLFSFAVFLFFAVNNANATTGFSHTISLEPGWNLISTPRLLESHQFSAPSTSANYDIYVMNPGSISKWSTMGEIGQTEFLPLFGYFINNKVGTTTTLILNYRENVAPNERFFSRNLLAGWNAIGVANPGYALKQKDPENFDSNNVKNITRSISSSTQLIYDLTANQTPKYTTKISDVWANTTYDDANNLNDFRETKAYVVYNNSAETFTGSQNNDQIFTLNPITETQIFISKKSTSPSNTTIVKGSDSTMLLANLHTDEAITADGLRVNYEGANIDQFENVRVYMNGALVDSFDPISSSTFKILDSAINLNSGDNEIKIMAKAKSNAISSSTIDFVLDSDDIFSDQNLVYSSSGNPVSADKISGNASSSIFTVTSPILTVVRNDGYADGKTIVQGATDVSLGKYTFKALNDTVKVTSIALAATTTSATFTAASSISDIKVFVDGVDTGKIVDWGTSGATISGLSIEIAKDTTKNIEIKGTFDSFATGKFKNVMTVTAQDSRGSNVTASSQPISAEFAVNANGTLSVALGGNTPAAGMLASKAGVEQEVAQFKFTATDDDASLTELNIINTPLASTTIASTSVGVNDADSRIASINLYNGSTLVDSITPVSGEGTFMISNDKVKVSANTNVTLTVKVVLNNISNDATATNKDIHFGLTTMKYKSSNGSITTAAIEKLANNFRIRKTVPTVQLAALPTTVLTTGDNVVSKFTVSADSNGDVNLHAVTLDVTTSASSTFAAVTASTTNTLKVNGTYKTIDSVAYSGNKLVIIFANDEVVSAGTSKTFEIYAATGVSGQGAESITTKISEDAAYVVGDNTGSLPASGSFIWSDGASISYATYSNGHRVNGLTTNTQVMSK